MPNPNVNRGFSKNKSLSAHLRNEGKSSEEFEIMLSTLTLEEVIGLKLECAMRLTDGKLYGFNLWSNTVEIIKEALYNATISIGTTNAGVKRILGINTDTLKALKKKYDIDRE